MVRYVGELGWDSQADDSSEEDLGTLLQGIQQEIYETNAKVDERRRREDVRDSEIAFLENVVDRMIANVNVLVRNQGRLVAKLKTYHDREQEWQDEPDDPLDKAPPTSSWVFFCCVLFSIITSTAIYFLRCYHEPTLAICL